MPNATKQFFNKISVFNLPLLYTKNIKNIHLVPISVRMVSFSKRLINSQLKLSLTAQ